MTLVLSLATPHYVVQVADRRISHLKNKTVMPDQNKSVMLCNRMAFAYTGMAVLESEQTSVWLWKVIQELKNQCSTSDVVYHIAKRATEAVSKTNRIHYPEDWQLRHAFIGVGWKQIDDGELVPTVCRITNYHDRSGKSLDLPAREFSVQVKSYTNNTYGLWETGTPLSARERALLGRRIDKCGKKGTGPAAPVRLFCDAIWKVHRRLPNVVSNNLLIVMIPKSAAMRHPIAYFTGTPGPKVGVVMSKQGCQHAEEPLRPEHMALFAYVPRQGERPVQHAPSMACPGRGAFSNFVAGPMEAGGQLA
jgi:hypothetical protein